MLCVGVVVALTGCSLLDNHRNLTLATVMESEFDGPDTTTNPEEITAAICDAEIDCVEAYSTDQADYLRFDSRDDAATYAQTLDDGFVVNYIVMDFAGKDAASKQEQRWAMETLAGTWQDYHGDFPDR